MTNPETLFHIIAPPAKAAGVDMSRREALGSLLKFGALGAAVRKNLS